MASLITNCGRWLSALLPNYPKHKPRYSPFKAEQHYLPDMREIRQPQENSHHSPDNKSGYER